MSKQLINNYYNELHRDKQYGGSHNEASIRGAFIRLVNSYAERRHLVLVPEIYVKGKKGNNVRPDGVLKNATRFEFGYWESKDTKDDLDVEINKKLNIDGYPDSNILFEDTDQAVLFQEGKLVQRVHMKDPEALDSILEHFINYEPSIVKDFNRALEKFKEDIPAIVEDLRELIERETASNPTFTERRDCFYELARAEINPEITVEDIREMLIQHILTEDIFNNVFGNANFHKFNNIASQLVGVLDSFMTYSVRQQHLSAIKSYYDTIRDASAGLADHHEKQKFLKNIYENFYKVYNPKGADRLGVVYTPNEIVKFMIESTDWLLEHHFGKSLGDKNVEILDPATGTGTFIVELIEYLSPHDLSYKYEKEIFANEVAILPYYIANLNIEYSYQQKMNHYAEFPNICFVDTLDNTDALDFKDKAKAFNFGLSNENAERVRRQNERTISVIIGNPPYNANQKSFNDFNSNRAYKFIDKRYKDTFVYLSSSKKHKYDMYLRFYRWAMDRVNKTEGIIAFVTNRGFLKDKSADGFRKIIEDEFSFAYVVDTKSDVIDNPKIAGTTHNVFGIKEGIAITFLIAKKSSNQHKCKIKYIELNDEWLKQEKIQWLVDNPIKNIPFDRIYPDDRHYWIEKPPEDENKEFKGFIPLIDEDIKRGKRNSGAIFGFYSLGVVTARDEWVYDFGQSYLSKKVEYLVRSYNSDLSVFKGESKESIKQIISGRTGFGIKWTRAVINDIAQSRKYSFDPNRIIKSVYRPFVKKFLYFSKELNEMQYQMPKVFANENTAIAFSGESSSKPVQVLAQNAVYGHDLLEKTQCLPRFVFDLNGEKHENITDWAVEEFARRGAAGISKEDIFHYVYAVLHSPAFREKYEQNLKREFPRIPVYKDAMKWALIGKELMELHLNYESAEPFDLRQVDLDLSSKEKGKLADFFSELDELDENTFTIKPVPRLRAEKTNGVIEIDTKTRLEGVPSIAWEYKLGNRSALEWVLDQYKERKPKDITIAEKFNTYKFAEYKDHVIDLLKRVCTVSVKTMEIIHTMPTNLE